MNDKNTRKAKILVNDEWIDIDSIDLKKDMLFKMYEEDGTSVLMDENDILKATKNAFYNDNGIVTIGVELAE